MWKGKAMARTIQYTQCTLERNLGTATFRQVSYIPTQFARLAAVLRLKNDAGQWVNGWKVVHVGSDAVDNANAPDYRKAIRNHRNNTGDSLPSKFR